MQHVLGDGTAGPLADGAEGVSAALGADGHLGDVGFRADDVGPVRDIRSELSVLHCPSRLGTVELAKIPVAAVEGGSGTRFDQPTGADDGKDDDDCDDEADREFPRSEADGWIVDGMCWLIVHG